MLRIMAAVGTHLSDPNFRTMGARSSGRYPYLEYQFPVGLVSQRSGCGGLSPSLGSFSFLQGVCNS